MRLFATRPLPLFSLNIIQTKEYQLRNPIASPNFQLYVYIIRPVSSVARRRCTLVPRLQYTRIPSGREGGAEAVYNPSNAQGLSDFQPEQKHTNYPFFPPMDQLLWLHDQAKELHRQEGTDSSIPLYVAENMHATEADRGPPTAIIWPKYNPEQRTATTQHHCLALFTPLSVRSFPMSVFR